MLVCNWCLKVNTSSRYQFPFRIMSHNAKSQHLWVRLGSWLLSAALVSDPGTAPGSLNNPQQQPTHWGSGVSSEKRNMVKQIIILSRSLPVLTKCDSPFPQIMSYTWEGKRKEINILSATHLCQASTLHVLTWFHPHHRPIGLVLLILFNS